MLLIGLLCISCKYISKPVVPEETLVEQEMETINWDTVDQYPSFSVCDTVAETEMKRCFQQTLTNHIYESLSKHEFTVTEAIDDTIQVTLLIKNDGKIQIENIAAAEVIHVKLPKLEHLLRESITTLPLAAPAHKRGIPVTTKFKLPIIIHVE